MLAFDALFFIFLICHKMGFSFYLLWKLQNGAAAPGSKSRIPPLASESLGFGQRHDATVDIPLDTKNVISLLIQRFS